MDNCTEQNSTERVLDTQAKSELKLPIPHCKFILTLGILSIFTSCCSNGVLGLLLSVIAIIMANKSQKEYNNNSDIYDENTLGKIKTGRTCAIIGLIMGVIIFVIAYIFLQSTGIIGTTDMTWDHSGY